jgi:hypothetical protein
VSAALHGHTSTATSYEHKETQGELCLWKRALQARYRRFERAFDSPTTESATYDFYVKKAVGRRRAFDKFATPFRAAGAVLEGVRMDGREPLAIWSILCPRSSSVVEAPEDATPAQEASLMQNCVRVNYAVVGVVGDALARAEGGWTLEVTDHTLGRLLDRAPGVSAEAAIMEAHHNLLRLRADQVVSDPNNWKFLIAAGPGVFACEFRYGYDVSLGGAHVCYVRAVTYLGEDQTWPSAPLADSGKGARLGNSYLLPGPLGQIEEGDGRVCCYGAATGLPEMLAYVTPRAAN